MPIVARSRRNSLSRSTTLAPPVPRDTARISVNQFEVDQVPRRECYAVTSPLSGNTTAVSSVFSPAGLGSEDRPGSDRGCCSRAGRRWHRDHRAPSGRGPSSGGARALRERTPRCASRASTAQPWLPPGPLGCGMLNFPASTLKSLMRRRERVWCSGFRRRQPDDE